MEIWPILLAGGAVRVGAETASVLADVDGFYPHVNRGGDVARTKALHLFWKAKDFKVAVFILLHYYALIRPGRFSGYFDPTAIFLGVCGAQKSNQSNCFTGTYAFPNVFLIPAIIVS